MKEEKSKLFDTLSTAGPTKPPTDEKPEIVASDADPNRIIVDIVHRTPIVVFFGPSQIGKTVALVRLARFLKDHKYKIEPDSQFRKNDPAYQQAQATFNDTYLNVDFKPDSTNAINFLLIKVKDIKGDVCQLLEAPGEHYFDPTKPDKDYLPYFHKIINNGIPKIYLFFLELNWQNSDMREKYESKVVNFTGNLGAEDSVIILVNKADERLDLLHNKKPNESAFKELVRQQYPAIYDTFLRSGLMRAARYKGDLAVFSAGNFGEGARGVFTNSIDYYPHHLWNNIKKRLKGGWLS